MSLGGFFTRGFASGILASSILYGTYDVIFKEVPIDVEYEEAKRDSVNVARGKEILRYGLPMRGPEVIYYRNHALCYDQAKRTPIWVAEHLTKDMLKGDGNRKRSRFNPDEKIPKAFTATNDDYWKSGWSRGHMAPAGDNKIDQQSMDETFLLTNIVPQDLKNNAGYWNRFEMYCRDLTQRFDNVRVISGPLIIPTLYEDGKRFVKYPVIGKSLVAVPTHLYKVIVAEKDNQIALGTFLVPNVDISAESKDLRDYQLSLEHLESHAGLQFVPHLNRAKTRNLCHVDSCFLSSQEKFDLYIIGRQLENAKSLETVENVWNGMLEKKLKPDKYLKDLYKRKLSELPDEKMSARAN